MKKVLTIIADGFGIRGETKDNAISLSKMHTFEQFFKDHPHTLIDASKENMGLLDNETISCQNAQKILGGGRVYHSKNYLINDFWNNALDNETFNKLLNTNTKPTHLFCFLRKDNIKNIVNCYNALKKANFTSLYIHIVSYEESSGLVEKLYSSLNKESFASICGIDFIDDNNDEGVVKYYKTITGNTDNSQDLLEYLSRYKNWNAPFNKIKPIRINNYISIEMDDNIVWLDQELKNVKVLNALSELGTNIYTYFKFRNDEDYFIEEEMSDNSLGQYLGKLDVKQARVAQNEKYDTLIKYFDASTKKIASCDRFKIDGIVDRPEMSIVDITKKTIELMDKDYAFIVTNFANCDVYGQKGDMNLAIQACMSVDVCLAKLIEEAEINFYTIVFVSDHGRIENIKHPEQASTLLPLIFSDDKVELKEGGTLKDFAPTILDYMEITIPEEMSGESLIIKK